VHSGMLLAARLALAAVFATAGIAKLADRTKTRRSLRDFGVPDRLTPPTAIVLPFAELAVAATLFVTSSARSGAAGALMLLGGFTAGIAANLIGGRTPDCHCFGQLHSSPIGVPTLIRNVVLGALGALVLWQGPGTSLAQVGTLSAAGRAGLATALLLGIVVAAEGRLLVLLLRQQGRLLLRLEELERAFGGGADGDRALAADFNLLSVSGTRVSLADLVMAGRPTLLVFTSSGCHPCTALFPEIGLWQRDYGEVLTVAVLARGDAAVNAAMAERHRVARVLIDLEATVARSYRALPSPSGVLVGPDGRFTSTVASGSDPIRALVLRTVDVPHEPAPAPDEVVPPRGPAITLSSTKR